MSDTGSSRSATPVAPSDDGNISIRSMASSSKGDLRRTSFILTAVQNALNTYGVTSKQIFQGEWIGKKICHDYSHKERFIWFDPTDKSFHWSKEESRTTPHKRLRLDKRIASVTRSKNMFTGVKTHGIVVTFTNDETLSLQWDGFGDASKEELEALETRISDWIKVFEHLAR